MEVFSFHPLTNLSEEGKWPLAVNSVFNITHENNGFSITTKGRWIPEGSGEIVDELNILSELRSQNENELYVKEVEKRHSNKNRKQWI